MSLLCQNAHNLLSLRGFGLALLLKIYCMRKKYCLLVLFFLHQVLGYGQVPDTDIYLLPLHVEQKGAAVLGVPQNITQRKGYDNQVCFASNDQFVLYTVMDENGKTDTYRYDLNTRTTQRYTLTDSTAEYSPKPTPDGKHFWTVVIEPDGKTQHIRLYDLVQPTTEGVLWQKNIANIGYYCPFDKDTMAVFVLGEPPTLQLISRLDTVGQIIAARIGRCLQKAPNSNKLSFVQEFPNGKKNIKIADLHTFDTQTIAPLIEGGSEDYVWLPNGCLLIGDAAGKLHLFDPKQKQKQKKWRQIADLSQYGVSNISRMAVSNNGKWLAIVAIPK